MPGHFELSVGTPDSAPESIHQAAEAFISGDNSLADLCSTLLSNPPRSMPRWTPKR